MASNELTDIGLESIRLIDAKPRSIPAETEVEKDNEVEITTTYGPMKVTQRGDVRKPAIFTYHDIGLNSTSCFQGFFNFAEMSELMKQFCVVHINAIGQHEGAPTLTEGSPYPTLDELAGMILSVLEHFNKTTFIGIGVGAGGNILSRFALMYPDKVEGLVIVNSNAGKCGWIEWGYQKWNAWYLKSGQMTMGVEEYLLWHWFGNKTMETNHDLVTVYMDYMRSIKPANLGHFVSAYIQRTDLGIVRELDPHKKAAAKNFKCQVMLVTGDTSPHVEDTVNMNGRLDPENSAWVKFACGGMVVEEVPGKLCEVIRLYLQGMGYVLNFRPNPEKNQLKNQILNNSQLNRCTYNNPDHKTLTSTPHNQTCCMDESEAGGVKCRKTHPATSSSSTESECTV